jgi:hypothetical protein
MRGAVGPKSPTTTVNYPVNPMAEAMAELNRAAAAWLADHADDTQGQGIPGVPPGSPPAWKRASEK